MIRLPEGVTVERSERDDTLRVRVRVLTEGLEEQSTNLRFQGDLEFIRDGMELRVLLKVCDELDRLRLAIKKAVDDA